MTTLRILFVLCLVFLVPLPAADLPSPPEADQISATIASLCTILDIAHPETASPDAAATRRPWKQSVAIIAAGAAAGASVGAATRRGRQAVIIGAVAGAAAGLIFDRATVQRQPASPAPPEPTPSAH